MKDSTYSLLNTVWLGFCFMILFGVFSTTSQIAPRFLESIAHLSNGTYSGNGYISLAMLSGTNAACGWFAPPIITKFGARACLVVSSLGYAVYMACVYQRSTWLMYLASIVLGACNSVFWASQGTYLSNASTKETMLRNTGIFMALTNSGRICGTVLVAFVLRGQIYISEDTRQLFFVVTLCASLFGTACLLCLRPIRKQQCQDSSGVSMRQFPLQSVEDDKQKQNVPGDAEVNKSLLEQAAVSNKCDCELKGKQSVDKVTLTSKSTASAKTRAMSPWESFVAAFELLRQRPIQQLFFVFFSTGVFSTYVNTVFGTSLSHTVAFGDMANSLMSVSATVCAGSSLATAILSILSAPLVNRYGRDIVMFSVFVARLIAYYLSFLQLPDTSPLVGIDFLSADQTTYITPRVGLLLFCSVLLGFADTFQNSMTYNIIRELNPDKPAQSFMIYRFFTALCFMVSYAYATSLTLKWQLIILVTMDTAAVIGFLFAEMHCVRTRQAEAEAQQSKLRGLKR